MKKIAALVFVCTAVVSVPMAEAQTQGNTNTPSSCTPPKQVYSEKNWQDPTPVNGQVVCYAAGLRNVQRHFREYRHYRQIATMKCKSGPEGYFVPNPGSCSTLVCESGLSWHAVNASSGADGVYQLLGHGQPWPIRGFHDRLVHHEIAATLPRSAWVC